jgi:hypothetical protein
VGQIPIQSGVSVKDGSLRTVYPVNLQQKLVESGVSKGELVATHGAVQVATGPGRDRGGIVWNGTHYRVMGPSLVTVSATGAITVLATVPDDGLPVKLDYSFDRLGISSAQLLFYWDGTTLTQVTDTDLMPVLDFVWMDGYFVTTDGTDIVVTQLNDPTSVDPLKYGSAEEDPDPVTGLEKLAEELVGFGRETIEFYRNVGGAGFPFQAVVGATIPYGCVAPRAKCRIGNTIAFVGSGKDEPLGVFVIQGGSATRISDEEIDEKLKNGGDEATITMETRTFGFEQQLVVHLETESVALSTKASEGAGTGLWHVLTSRTGRYRPRHAVWFANKHWVGDVNSATLGTLDTGTADHFGETPEWQFGAGLLYNGGEGAIIHEVELTGQFSGQAVFFAMTYDGETWSREISRRLSGRPQERVVWRPNVRMAKLAAFRFRGHGKVAIARMDFGGEPLSA